VILDREGERFEHLAEALARMWVEHPESLTPGSFAVGPNLVALREALCMR
jgi:hypothetical protein